jgi:hypothetical protein
MAAIHRVIRLAAALGAMLVATAVQAAAPAKLPDWGGIRRGRGAPN